MNDTMTTDTYAIPQALYDSESTSASRYFDGGWMIKLGDDNRWASEVQIEPALKFEDALQRLKLLAIGYYQEVILRNGSAQSAPADIGFLPARLGT